jgi:hypothetical protein
VNGVVFDVNIQGSARHFLRLVETLELTDVWRSLDVSIHTVAGLGYMEDVSDRVIWTRCQADGLVLVTENRNDDGPDSLQRTMDELRTADSLPVLTLASRERFQRDRRYALIVAEELLNALVDIEAGLHRGAGRMYLPPRPVI